MIKEWFLIIIIVVQTHAGEIDERALYPVKKDDMTTCKAEAEWTEKMFESQLGNSSLRRLTSGDGDHTYQTQLGGKLIGFSVGCEERVYEDESWETLLDPAPFFGGGRNINKKPNKPKKKVTF